MIRKYSLGPFPMGSVEIRQSVNFKNKNLTKPLGTILKRMEHYVNGAHIQLERIKRDTELMKQSSTLEDGWDIGLWCQMLDTHYLAISVNMAADLANTFVKELEPNNSRWEEIKFSYQILNNEFLHPLRDALEHMEEGFQGLEGNKPVPPEPATFEIDIDEQGITVFIWGDVKFNLTKMVDDLTAIYENTVLILEQATFIWP